jgi:hypothetical protein
MQLKCGFAVCPDENQKIIRFKKPDAHLVVYPYRINVRSARVKAKTNTTALEAEMAHYHCDVNAGVKGEGGKQVASSHYAYICRSGVFAKLQSEEETVFVTSGNMPSWAAHDASLFWLASDTYERENGSVYRECEVALPRELTREQRIAIVKNFIDRVLPQHAYTLAIHEKAASDGLPQPHVHLMFSERIQDDVERAADVYFKRAAAPRKGKNGVARPVDPAAGGCRKDSMQPRLMEFRELWASLINDAYKNAGLDFRVDHRSFADQGIEREPQKHIGPGRREAVERARMEMEEAELAAFDAMRAATAIESIALADRIKIKPKTKPVPVEPEVPAYVVERLINRIKIPPKQPPRPLFHPLDAIEWDDAYFPPRKRPEALMDDYLRPAPLPRKQRPRAFDPDADSASVWRGYRERLMEDAYGKSSQYIAAYWYITRRPPKREIEFKNRHGRIVDKGASITADNGNSSEIKAMIELAKVKEWKSITFQGTDDFKLQAMILALEERINVVAKSEADAKILAEAQRIVGGGGHNRVRPKL